MLDERGTPKVDVFDISPPRSGNNWLAWCLEAHPDICVARPPTPGPHKAPEILPTGPRDLPFVGLLDEYRARFSHAEEDQLLADTSTYQLTHARKAIRRIQEHNPDARIVAVLRDPALRLLDHYHAARRHAEPIIVPTLFEDALDVPGFLDTSRYATYLEPWLDAFGPDRVHVILDTDLHADPAATVEKLREFLGLRTDIATEDLATATSLLPDRETRVPEAYQSILRTRRRTRTAPGMGDATRRRVARLLEPEIEALQTLLGRDLEVWRPTATEPDPELKASRLAARAGRDPLAPPQRTG